MRPSRLLLLSLICFLSILILLSASRRSARLYHSARARNGTKKSGIRAMFSFRTPLFPSSAIISLTDDNSTFFLSRPAAFGPLLPGHGLSGQLWVGRGFGEDPRGWIDSRSIAEGELGCSDTTAQEESITQFEKAVSTTLLQDKRPGFQQQDSVTKHANHPRSLPTENKQQSYSQSTKTQHDDARLKKSLVHVNTPASASQASSEIAGKIVLLSRGGCGFLEKVEWAQRRGAIAVVVGDNIPGGALITMYAKGDTSDITIPAIFTSHTTAHLLSSLMPPNGLLDSEAAMKLRHSGWIKAKQAARPRISERSVSRFFYGILAAVGLINHNEFAKHGFPFIPQDNTTPHEGLWITLTPTNMSSSPFFDTILVLVISPLITLTVVYAILLIRSRIRRRRWRAPKSVVERLPVRTYHTIPSSGASTAALPTPTASSPATPLLLHTSQTLMPPTPRTPLSRSHSRTRPRSRFTGDVPDISLHDGDDENEEERVSMTESEKREKGLAEWRRKYGGKQKECVVCLEEYLDGISQVMSLPCGHEFHVDCITPWLTTRRRTCPICKGDVVRSMARHELVGSPSSSRNHMQLSDEFDDNEDDIQDQAAFLRNDSPSAQEPIPMHDDDLESGIQHETNESSILTWASSQIQHGRQSLNNWIQRNPWWRDDRTDRSR